MIIFHQDRRSCERLLDILQFSEAEHAIYLELASPARTLMLRISNVLGEGPSVPLLVRQGPLGPLRSSDQLC